MVVVPDPTTESLARVELPRVVPTPTLPFWSMRKGVKSPVPLSSTLSKSWVAVEAMWRKAVGEVWPIPTLAVVPIRSVEVVGTRVPLPNLVQ